MAESKIYGGRSWKRAWRIRNLNKVLKEMKIRERKGSIPVGLGERKRPSWGRARRRC